MFHLIVDFESVLTDAAAEYLDKETVKDESGRTSEGKRIVHGSETPEKDFQAPIELLFVSFSLQNIDLLWLSPRSSL